MKDRPEFKQLEQMAEPCESTCMSAYIDVSGNFHPCSFAEGCVEPQSVLKANSFMDIWNSTTTNGFRDKLIAGCRNCPLYNV